VVDHLRWRDGCLPRLASGSALRYGAGGCRPTDSCGYLNNRNLCLSDCSHMTDSRDGGRALLSMVSPERERSAR
jgi:hypothetical protein